jgi:energy-coupling factor transport system ATP-binding protein
VGVNQRALAAAGKRSAIRMLIQVQGLTHLYSPRTPLAHLALRGIELEIKAGERVGIIGSTGSGKSTLVQHLAGLLKPTFGQVLLDGVPAHGRTSASRAQRRQVGIAFQYPEDQIFEQTVFREVGFGLHNAGLAPDVVEARVRSALESVGLDAAAIGPRNPLTCSGGEMRRIALASVLSVRPQVLILDEPTAGLDPRGRRDLLTYLQGLQADKLHPRETERVPEGKATLIVISHDLGELAKLVERVLLLSDGRLVADGPARQILGNADLLRAHRLDAPEPVALLTALRNLGWPVRTDRLSPREAVAEIVRARRAREALSTVGAQRNPP